MDALIEDLDLHENNEAYFYDIRAKDTSSMTDVQQASRFIYLNKTCFNGLYRENKQGKFNVPFGRYKNPKILERELLKNVSSYLKSHNVTISCQEYSAIGTQVAEGDFVYFDPPYAPLTSTANFVRYNKAGFNVEHQIQLADFYRELSEKGVKLMLSNSHTELIMDLYKGFKIKPIKASRCISCKSVGRGKAFNEVLVMNY